MDKPQDSSDVAYPLPQRSSKRRKRSPISRLLFWLACRLAPPLIDGYLRFVDWTSTRTILHGERDRCKLHGEPTVFVSFHQGFPYFAQHFRDRNGVVMASASRDAELAVRVIQRLGIRAARGSDSNFGKQALSEMIPIVRDEGISGGLVCDGPRGPYGAAKIGIILLARDAGRPLVPCSYWFSRKKLLSNWDRTLLPLPFSKIVFSYGPPIEVPSDATREQCEALRQTLSDRIAACLFECQEAIGEPRQDFRAPAERGEV
jgi:lysophospholipid acyltransferase (LPLAT)-like uncharacterized protein